MKASINGDRVWSSGSRGPEFWTEVTGTSGVKKGLSFIIDGVECLKVFIKKKCFLVLRTIKVYFIMIKNRIIFLKL